MGEIKELLMENEALRHENLVLKNKLAELQSLNEELLKQDVTLGF